MGMTLRCTAGPCAGQSIIVDAELVLGREEPDPGHLGGDARLSRRHARISFDDRGRPVIEDLGSTNGTWINEERLVAPHVCTAGDILRVGQGTFELEVDPPRDPAVAPRGAATVADQPAAAPVLEMTAGSLRGEEIPIGAELLLGRSFGEPGALGGDRRLSRRHARIARGPGGVFFIEDTGSSNGTSVNGTLVRRPRALRDGDEIEVGSSKLVARGLPPAPSLLASAAAAPASPQAGAPGPQAGAPDPPAAPPVPPRAPAAPAAPAAVMPESRPEPPPEPESPPLAAPGTGTGFLPQGAAAPRLSSRRGRVVGLFAGVFVLSVIVAVAVVVLAAPLVTRTCPQGFECNPPPMTPPLHATASFTGSLGWTVEYDPQSAHTSVANASGNELVLQETSRYDERALGVAPNSKLIGVFVRGYRTAQTSPTAAENALANELTGHLLGTDTAPTSDQLFTRPAVGFHPAVGEVLEGNTQTPQGPGPLVKVAIMSAASGGVTLAVGIVYPIRRSDTQGENPNRVPDAFGDEILGTVRFPRDGAT
jgi:pSer/pThr/pTyr-binding forkhead associated (FHA) protein